MLDTTISTSASAACASEIPRRIALLREFSALAADGEARAHEPPPAIPTLEHLTHAIQEVGEALQRTRQRKPQDGTEALRRARAFVSAELHWAGSDVDVAAVAGSAAGRGPRLATWQIRRVKTYIDLNLCDRISVPELAARTNLSLSHFSRAFRNSVGDPPHLYISRRRTEFAKLLMLRTTRPLADIAIECGFSDQAHLTRMFRHLVKQTPASWRRQQAVKPE